MSTQALGSLSFLDTPDVNGNLVLTTVTGLTQGSLVAGSNITISTGATPTIALADNPVFTGTTGVVLPAGTTAQRPSSPVTGTIRTNTTTGVPEAYALGTWLLLGRNIQTVTGNIGTTTGSGIKTTTTVPLVTEGIQVWSQAFTPQVAASTVLVQFSLTVSHGTAGRQVFVAVFAGSTCIGMTTAWIATAVTMVTIPFQCAYQPGATSAITFQARVGTFGNSTSAATVTGTGGAAGAAAGAVFVNESSAAVSFTNALQTEYRLTELM